MQFFFFQSSRRTNLLAVAGAALTAVATPAVSFGQQPAAAPAKAAAAATAPAAAADDDDGDLARKVEIMNSPRWRRAIFELGEWLSSQKIYSPQEVHNIKADFNKRVTAMSSYELEYLLEDLDNKFKILETPEAKDARQWVGQYLSVMSDTKRAEVLKDVPNVVKMSSAQLQQEIDKIEQMKAGLQQRQAAFDSSRQQLVDRAQAARQATAAASNAAAAQMQSGVSYSPYRGSQGGGKPPFSDAKGSGMSVGVGPWGAYVNMNVGNF
jgi:pyruvate/2-oxoglutarate dehydrogenase complex dihydrolipoamide acyltransferase (E2) component